MWPLALLLIPSSHLTVRALPYLAATAVTIGWKSVSVGASPSLPFHFGCARSRIDFGSCDGLSWSVL